MKNTTKVAIVGLLSAAGSLLNAFALEFAGDALEAAEPPAPAKLKKDKKATPPPVETPAEPAAEPAAEESTTAVLPTEEQYQKNRAVIEPLVKAGQGEDVKKVIKKYAGEDGTLKTMDPKHNAAFEKDIAALAY